MRTLFFFIFTICLTAQIGIPAVGQPKSPKVKIDWTKYYDSKGIQQIVERLTDAYPNLIRVEKAGESEHGKDIPLLIITDFNTKTPHSKKPAMYADGNIHSNEIQGTEVILYTSWFLIESFNENSFVRDLLKKKTFYFLPSINMDARDDFFHKPNSRHSPRSGLKALDDDLDGAVNEDPPNDLNNDNEITSMIRKVA